MAIGARHRYSDIWGCSQEDAKKRIESRTFVNAPRDLSSMFLLNCMVGDYPIYDDLRVKISKVLEGLDIVQLYEASPDDCAQYILFTSQLATGSMTTTLMNRVWEECRSLAQHLAASDSTNEKKRVLSEKLSLPLTDAAIRLSSSQDGRNTRVQTFVKKLADLARSWPAFAIHTKKTISWITPTSKPSRWPRTGSVH